jgi:hypothetical protein
MVKDYKYLGKILRNKNEIRPESVKRVTDANRSYCAVLPLPKSQSVFRAAKIKTYKRLIRPLAAYGAES